MGFQSQEGTFGMAEQGTLGTPGTPVDFATGDPVWARLRGGALGANRELIIPDPEIGGDRDITDANMGPVSYSGDYEFYARMEMLATLFRGAFGASSSFVPASTTSGVASGGAGWRERYDLVAEHIITPVDTAGNIPVYTLQEDIAGGLDAFEYDNAVVTGLSLECEPDNYLMGSTNLLAINGAAATIEVPAAPAADPSTNALDTVVGTSDLTPLMVGTNMTVEIADPGFVPGAALTGVLADITRSFSFDFQNNYEDDVFELGSIALADLTPKRRELTTNMTLRPQGSSTLWREAVFGGAAAVTPQPGAAANKGIRITVATFQFVGVADTTAQTGPPTNPLEADATPFTIVIDIPNVTIEPFNYDPSADDVVEYDVTFQGIRPGAAPICTVNILNGISTIR